MRRVDVAIVGGGPAGLAAAIEAARRGLSVLVLERQGPAPDKACGEGLMPSGWRALEALGAAQFVPTAARGSFVGIRYLQENGTTIAARFRHGAGIGVRRLELVAALQQAATQQGAELCHYTLARDVKLAADRVTLLAGNEPLEAGLLIAADGLASPLRRQAGLDGPPVSGRRFGLRRHFRRVRTSGFVDVHWGPDVEAYVTPVGEDRCGVAFLFDANRIAQPTFNSLLARFPAVEEQLLGAIPDSEVRGAGPLHRRVPRCVKGRLVLLGDAAGYVDAITGEGLSLAFESARALGAVLPDALARPDDPRPLQRYARAHARLFRSYAAVAGSLVWLSRQPRLRRALFDLCGWWPGLFEGAVQLAAEAG